MYVPSWCCIGLKAHGGLGHLALTKLRQKHLVHGELAALGAEDVFFKLRPHVTFIYPDLAHVTIEFVSTFLALEVNCSHRFVSDLCDCER
jgi:hypothetical protein